MALNLAPCSVPIRPIGDRNSTVPFLRDLGWGAIVQTEEEAVFSNVDVIMFRSIVTAVLAAVLGGILVVVFAGRLSRPIAELAEGARRLASGDFSQNIVVASGNEIGEFAETFNFMILEIRRFIEQLRRAAEEKQANVSRRRQLPSGCHRREGPLYRGSFGARRALLSHDRADSRAAGRRDGSH